MLPESCLQGGAFVSEQHLQQPDIDRIVNACGTQAYVKAGPTETQLWGVPWTEEQFAKQMVEFGHPASLKSGLPAVLNDTICKYRSMDVHERMAYRASRLGYWLRMLVSLKEDEAALKQQIDSEVLKVIGQKNVLLWKAMLKSVDYPDQQVTDEFVEGTDLVGCVERTGLWPARFQPASISVDELCNIATMERNGIHDQFQRGGSDEFSETVWSKTLEEVQSGALEGPIPLVDIAPDVPLSRRFGIQQGHKIRCIDDFSRSSVNATVQSCESPKPHTLDVFAAMCIQSMTEVETDSPWVGRTFDLVGAYRQCAVRPSSQKFAHIVVRCPLTSGLFGFRMRALPFGAIRSVHAFLRFSHSLWYVLVKDLLILTTNYFDDFVSIAASKEASSVQSCMHMFFKLVGWQFAEVGEKAPEFAELFSALGVSINVSQFHRGLVMVGNTESRRKELVELLEALIETQVLHKAEALRLRGRLQFAAGNVFGRIARASLAVITQHAYHSHSPRLDQKAVLALTLHRSLLLDGRPRELKPARGRPWFVQTDACYEPDGDSVFAGIGAVLFNENGRPVRFFSQRLDADLLQQMNPEARKTAIYECEFFALFCAFLIWGDRLRTETVFYTDNNAVRDALISCSTSNRVARGLLVATVALETVHQVSPWYARVPTDSNYSDGPSRQDSSKVRALGATEDELDVVDCWARHQALARKWGEPQA